MIANLCIRVDFRANSKESDYYRATLCKQP